jgi:hypothetical protein
MEYQTINKAVKKGLPGVQSTVIEKAHTSKIKGKISLENLNLKNT